MWAIAGILAAFNIAMLVMAIGRMLTYRRRERRLRKHVEEALWGRP